MSGEANADEPVVVVPEGDSLVYEEELLRNPYSLKLWLRYLEVSTNYARHLYLHRKSNSLRALYFRLEHLSRMIETNFGLTLPVDGRWKGEKSCGSVFSRKCMVTPILVLLF